MIRACRVVVLLVLSPLLALPAPAAAADPGKRALTLEDLYRVQNPGQPDLSPDGGHLVYSVRSTDLPRGRSDRDLYRIPTAGGEPRRLTWTDGRGRVEPRPTRPTASSIAFVARRGEASSTSNSGCCPPGAARRGR